MPPAPSPRGTGATAPSLACSLVLDDGQAPSSLRITPYLGRAVDELRVEVRGLRGGRELYRYAASARLYSDEPWPLTLPGRRVDELRLVVASSFLPFVKLRDIEVATAEAAR